MFYNLENFFDLEDDPGNQDDEFTPGGSRHWNSYKYHQKKKNLMKVIAATGGWTTPAIVGVCEVEKRSCLEDLFKGTPLSRNDYQIIHRDSEDHRGIDVALAYQESHFELLDTSWIRLTGKDGVGIATREILYAKGKLISGDILHVFVNHWPSRYSGQKSSEPLRLLAAKTLKIHTDSILKADPEGGIVLMGDFNDGPNDKSIQLLTTDQKLFNAMSPYISSHRGTLIHQDPIPQWYLFDQIIVSKNLIEKNGELRLDQGKASIYNANWLLEADGQHLFRTYKGFSYQGGFSDHLPVYCDLMLR